MAQSDPQEGKGGGGLMGFVIVSVIALGLGAGFGMLLLGNGGKEEASKPAAKETAAAPKLIAPKSYPGAKIVEMAPIVTSLAGPGDTWIRIEASILVQGLEQGSEVLAAQLSEDLAAYLKTTALWQFEGPSGFQNLREDFLDRATIRDREHIKDVIIHGVVVE